MVTKKELRAVPEKISQDGITESHGQKKSEAQSQTFDFPVFGGRIPKQNQETSFVGQTWLLSNDSNGHSLFPQFEFPIVRHEICSFGVIPHEINELCNGKL